MFDKTKRVIIGLTMVDKKLSQPLPVREITMSINNFLNQEGLPYVFIVLREKQSGLLRALSLRKDQIEKKAPSWFVLKSEKGSPTSSKQALYDWDQVNRETGVKLNMFSPYAEKLFSEEGLPEEVFLQGNYSKYKVLFVHPYIRKPVVEQLPYSDRYWEKD